MNLRANQITLGELLQNPCARALLQANYPGLLRSPLVRRFYGMTLAQGLALIGGRLSPNQVRYLLTQLANCPH